MSAAPEETTHRGVKWRRDPDRSLHFYDDDGGSWVRWSPGADAPPLPPAWAGSRPGRPGWRTHWRLIPIVLILAAVGIAVAQVYHSSGNQTAKEATAAEAMLGKCLAQHGTFQGHPKYSSAPVACTSPTASVKVIQVVSTAPGSPGCPAGSSPVVLAIYSGVRYPHLECVRPLRP